MKQEGSLPTAWVSIWQKYFSNLWGQILEQLVGVTDHIRIFQSLKQTIYFWHMWTK